MGGYAPHYHDAGQWLQPSVPETEQYYLKSVENSDTWVTSDVPGQLALIRLDGADIRTVAHLSRRAAGHVHLGSEQRRRSKASNRHRFHPIL